MCVLHSPLPGINLLTNFLSFEQNSFSFFYNSFIFTYLSSLYIDIYHAFFVPHKSINIFPVTKFCLHHFNVCIIFHYEYAIIILLLNIFLYCKFYTIVSNSSMIIHRHISLTTFLRVLIILLLTAAMCQVLF